MVMCRLVCWCLELAPIAMDDYSAPRGAEYVPSSACVLANFVTDGKKLFEGMAFWSMIVAFEWYIGCVCLCAQSSDSHIYVSYHPAITGHGS
jgi:hypothetical protein